MSDVNTGTAVEEPGEGSEEAGRELVKRARKDGNIEEPDFAFLFCSTEFDLDDLASGIESELDAEWIGGTAPGTLSGKGFRGNSAVLMVVESGEIRFSTGSSGGVTENPVRSSREALEEAVMPEQDRLANDLVFTVLPGFTQARYGREFEFLGEVKKMLDSGFEVVGGSAADHRLEENFQMVNGEVFSDAAVVAHLSTDLEVVTGQDHGMHEEVATGIVTEVEGRELREISGEPAAEFYADAVGASVEDLSAVYDLDLKEKLKAGLRYSRMKLMGEDPVTVHDVVSYSMDNAIATAMGPDSYRILSPYQVTDENGLMMAAEMEESQPVYVMRGDREDIIEAGKNAFPGFDRSSAALAVITDCGTRFTNLEADELERETELIRERLGEDFVGFYGLGEIGGKGEDICTFMNQTVTGFALKNGS